MLVFHIPRLALGIVQLTAHLGAHCVSVFMVDLRLFNICVIVHVWITHSSLGEQLGCFQQVLLYIRLSLSILSACIFMYIGKYIHGGEFQGNSQSKCLSEYAGSLQLTCILGKLFQLTFPYTFTRYCVLELGDLSMWEVKVLFHYSFDLYFSWVVYLLIFKSPL